MGRYFVYLVGVVGDERYAGRFKIGVTTNLGRRMSTLRCSSPIDLELTHSIEFSKESLMSKAEKWLHNDLGQFNVRGEWFDLPVEIPCLLKRYSWIGSKTNLALFSNEVALKVQELNKTRSLDACQMELLTKDNIAIGKSRYLLTKIDQARYLSNEGFSKVDIAKEMGVSRTSIQRWLDPFFGERIKQRIVEKVMTSESVS